MLISALILSIPVVVSLLIIWATVVISVSRAVAWVIHVASRPAVSSVTIINHATVHRTDRQNGKEYRRNELLHVESSVNQG
jgi:hypothetical protein